MSNVDKVRVGGTDYNMAASGANVGFDNTGTGLNSTNVQGAIVEVNSSLSDKQNKTLTTSLTINGTLQTSVEGALGGLNTLATMNRNKIRRTRNNISSRVSDLVTAISEQNLEKYGFSVGDYFESPNTHSLTQESWNATTSTLSTSTVNVKFKYHIADIDTYYGSYVNNAVINTHHVALVVVCMLNRQWHSGDASTVGYNGSKLHAYLKGDIFNAIKVDIAALAGGTWDSHLIKHNKLLTTAISNWAWQNDLYISALTESEIYGHREWSANSYQEGEAVKPLELFRKFRFNEIFGNMWIWLRNMQAASVACGANFTGHASNYGVVNTHRAAGLILFH